MIVIDSSALLAVLFREPEADSFLHLILGANGCLLSSVTLLETSIVLAGKHGDAGFRADLDSLIVKTGIQVIAFGAELAETSRRAFLRYRKGRHPAALNFGDCASYALAKSRNLPLLFKGNDFSHADLVKAS